MRATSTLAGKEFRGVFSSPIAYMMLGFFLLISGWFFYTIAMRYAAISLQMLQMARQGMQRDLAVTDLFRGLFGNMSIVMLIVLPLLTMRAYSEEKKSGTMELLITYPIKLGELVGGKFLGTLGFFVVMLILSIQYPIMVMTTGTQFEWGPIIGCYLGLFLMGAAFVSLGLFISAMTENQIVAAVVTTLSLLLFWLIGWVDPESYPTVANVFKHLSIMDHFLEFTKGVISIQDIVYYLGFTAFFIFLTIRALEWKPIAGIKIKNMAKITLFIGLMFGLEALLFWLIAPGLTVIVYAFCIIALLLIVTACAIDFIGLVKYANRFFSMFGFGAIVLSVVFAAILVLAYVIAGRHDVRWDITKTGMHTLSEESIKVVENIKQPVEAIVLYDSRQPGEKEAIEDLLGRYQYRNKGNFSFKSLNPTANPAVAEKYDVQYLSGSIVILKMGEKWEKVEGSTEEMLTNGIIRLTRAEAKKIVFIAGHGEKALEGPPELASLTQFKESLDKRGIEHETINLATRDIPEDAEAAFIIGPKKDFLEGEISKLEKYIAGKGNLVCLVDPGELTNLTNFLRKYGITLHNDIIIDRLSRMFGQEATVAMVMQYDQGHDITKGFNLNTLLPLARSLEVETESQPDKTVTAIAYTSPGNMVWGETDIEQLQSEGTAGFDSGADLPGPLSVAATSVLKKQGEEKETRIVAVGDSDFAGDKYYRASGNSDFLLNIVGWVISEEETIAIKPKSSGFNPMLLSSTQRALFLLIPVIVVPQLLFIIGIIVFVNRRR